MTILKGAELEDQLPDQVEAQILFLSMHCVIKHQNAHSIKEDYPMLERKQFPKICRLRHNDPILVWVIRENLHLVLAANRVLDTVPDGKTGLLVQDHR